MNDVAAHDLEAFRGRLRGLGFFRPGVPITLARAPGRLDVMGGIADYSGSLVLELPIREATCAAVQSGERDEGLEVISLSEEERRFAIDRPGFARLLNGDEAAARRTFEDDHESAWAAYVAGVAIVLHRHLGASFDHGLRIVIWSRVPEGKGVSSSAALEVAVMKALAAESGLSLTGPDLAHWCQFVENRVVGAPCGIMDQMTSALGRERELLALLCQPAIVRGFVPVPDAIGFWGVDSGLRHAVSGSDYTSVRTGAFMGLRILAELCGKRPERIDDRGVVHIDRPPWEGHLANIDPARFTAGLAEKLPEFLEGHEFLKRYGGTTDPVTRVVPDRVYAVRQPTAHPIHEHARVRRFAQLLEGPLDGAALHEMGALMKGSHASYSACGLGSEATDRLVALVEEAGPAAGLFGAKITGGGSGGTVAILGWADAEGAVRELASRYESETGRHATVFSGSSPGAEHVGVRRVTISKD